LKLCLFLYPKESEFQLSKQTTKDTVIFDIDGTLAIIDHRRHFVEGKGSKATDEDWRNFYAACVDDEPNWPVILMNQLLFDNGYRVIIFSGRSKEVERETLDWLKRFDVRYHKIFMREEKDFLPDEKLKKKWLAKVQKNRVLVVFDDRQKVVDMWRRAGLTCFQVAPGGF
jgi:hypothetical protein